MTSEAPKAFGAYEEFLAFVESLFEPQIQCVFGDQWNQFKGSYTLTRRPHPTRDAVIWSLEPFREAQIVTTMPGYSTVVTMP